MSKTYSIEDVAAMTGLSVRTVRSYVSDRVLQGEKEDGTWRFTPEQFSDFLAQDMPRRSIQAKAQGMVYDFLLQDRRQRTEVCAVLDLPTAPPDEEARRETLLERVNALGLALHYRWDGDHGLARCILQGPPKALARLLAELE